jgi:hypothetical protein
MAGALPGNGPGRVRSMDPFSLSLVQNPSQAPSTLYLPFTISVAFAIAKARWICSHSHSGSSSYSVIAVAEALCPSSGDLLNYGRASCFGFTTG